MRDVKPHCLKCGKPTKVFASSGRIAHFCGDSCRASYSRRLKTAAKKAAFQCSICGGNKSLRNGRCAKESCRQALGQLSQNRTCKKCGKSFRPQSNDRITFCSRKCFFENKKANPKRTRLIGKHTKIIWCELCGIPDRLRNSHSKFCSRCNESGAVRRRELARVVAKYYADRITDQGWIKCKECSKVWWAFTYASQRSCCSRQCQRLRDKRMDTHGNHRKRAAKHGVPYEPIPLDKLIERDSGRCIACGRKVFRKKSHHTRRATIGHIVPLSKGGPHTWNNVQLECWKCNTSRGTETHGQRRLWEHELIVQ